MPCSYFSPPKDISCLCKAIFLILALKATQLIVELGSYRASQ